MNKKAVSLKKIEGDSIMAIAESYMQTQVALPTATYVPGDARDDSYTNPNADCGPT